MIRRLFYMLLGAGITLWVMRRLRALRPESLARRAAGRAAGIAQSAGHSARAFALDAQDGMHEREIELRRVLRFGDNLTLGNQEKDGR